MPKPTDTKKKKKAVKINSSARSNVAEFIKRPVPTSEEVEEFERVIENEAREEAIEESLNEIYQDAKDNLEVNRLKIERSRGWLFWLVFLPLFLAILAGGGYAAYHFWYLNRAFSPNDIEFFVDGPEEVLAGEEFFYVLHYQNNSQVKLKKLDIKLKYPDNFVVLDVSPSGRGLESGSWEFNDVPPNFKGSIRIKGKIIGPKGEVSILLGSLLYEPANITSSFQKETSFVTKIKGIGLEFDYDYISPVMAGEKNEIIVMYNADSENFINTFRLRVEPPDLMEFIKTTPTEDKPYEIVRPGVFRIKEVSAEVNSIEVPYKFIKKTEQPVLVELNFEQADEYGRWHNFLTHTISLEAIQSDLGLALIVNGSRRDQGINFGQILNYSLVYANRGEADLKDVTIMAVLEGDFLDWDKLEDKNHGQIKDNTIVWTKNEIKALAVLEPGEEGTIDFSLPVKKPEILTPNKNYQIRSYAQYSVGGTEPNEDNRSNVIVNTVNSDLELREEVRYFDKDDIPVGTGPVPLEVGKETSLKVYWTITNTLHELTDVKVSVELPTGVEWNNKENASAGSIYYDDQKREVVWEVGRLPVSWEQVEAEFSIKVVPQPQDLNKILVLMPGSTVMATDKETKEVITKNTTAKTSRLEDDPIAQNSGIVVNSSTQQ